jgi:dsRNA-specific ribonuclease
LPLSVDAAVRYAQSQKIWQSERNARKDAAFEAYVALYKAGLVNDNLMPLLKKDYAGEELKSGVEKRPSMVEASQQYNPWVGVAQAWGCVEPKSLRMAVVTVKTADDEILSAMEMILPVDIPSMHPLRLRWDATTELWIDIKATNRGRLKTNEQVEQAQQITMAILHAAFGWRFPIAHSDLITLFRPLLESWEEGSGTPTSLTEVWKQCEGMGLVRDMNENGQPYIFEQFLNHKPSASLVKRPYKGYEEVQEDVAHLSLRRLPRQAQFSLRSAAIDKQPMTKRFAYVLPTTRCLIDDVPSRLAQFAILQPCILHRLEIFMLAQTLSTTVLADVHFNNISLVVTAISASSAGEETNYQRLEFLGDSMLKMYTSLQLLAEQPLWHEGYLSARKDQIVSNSSLARAALQLGLDKFIITKRFVGRKWRPPYVRDIIDSEDANSKREISSKVLADVVEALIGAANIDGGAPKALACIRAFLPEVSWQPLEERVAIVFQRAPHEMLPPHFEPLEGLIGYTFNRKALLLESITHASCNSGTASLERLEFLGDAVLDSLVVSTISKQETQLSHVKMHTLRSAFVNADFLAFICMEWTFEQEKGTVVKDENTYSFYTSMKTTPLALWMFMRRSSHVLTTLQNETVERHRILRDEINASFARGSHYPWALLSRLQAPKFFSDIVESLLGAVYIDSGSFEACELVIERMGILPRLRRTMRDEVHILHPKEQLGILADAEKVKYIVRLEKEIIENLETKSYTCEVFVGETRVVLVTDGVSREEAKTKGAEAAVLILKERGDISKGNNIQEEDNSAMDDVMDTT